MSLRSGIKILFVCTLLSAITLSLCRIFGISRIIPPFLLRREEVNLVKNFPFSDADSLKEWNEKVFNKSVDYKIESLDNESYVHAVSDRSCSAMYYRIKLDVYQHPIISWKWRINSFPCKKSSDNLLSREEDDFAARVYIIFPALFFSNSKVLEYIWAKDIKIDTISSSPYSDNIKVIVIESGVNEGNGWIVEERDVYKDYVSAFNSRPGLKIGAIAFMCDSDSTKSSAEAFFDEIKIFYKK